MPAIGPEIGKKLLDTLRQADHPLTLEVLATRLLLGRDVDPKNRRMFRDVKSRAYNALKRYTTQGLLRQTGERFGKQAWEVAQ